MDRKIKKIIIHCADTREDNPDTPKNEEMDIGLEEINEWHKARGFTPYNEFIFCGYHQVIRRRGLIEIARPDSVVGIHCSGQNSDSLAVCLVGVRDYTEPQMKALIETIFAWMSIHKLEVKDVFGHYEFDKQGKTCPNIEMVEFREKLTIEWNRRQNGIPS